MAELLTEKTRRDLLNQSKNADVVKQYGTTRYDRRNKQHIYNSISSFNKIDMNALFKGDMLSFKVPVHGETDNYEVEVLFDGACSDIKREIKRNKDKFEYKCVYRALIDAINKQDIYIACSCPDWKYRFAYWATKNRFNGGVPEVRVADITNPGNTKGAGCKHTMAVLYNLDWAMKLASSISNYVEYMQEHYEDKFANIIFPALYDMPYDKAVQMNLFGDEELADTMDNEEDTEDINIANKRSEYQPKETNTNKEVETQEKRLPNISKGALENFYKWSDHTREETARRFGITDSELAELLSKYNIKKYNVD